MALMTVLKKEKRARRFVGSHVTLQWRELVSLKRCKQSSVCHLSRPHSPEIPCNILDHEPTPTCALVQLSLLFGVDLGT